MKKKEKPKYNMWQNVVFMIGKAWKVRKSVLWWALSLVLIDIAINGIQLFMAPSILDAVENAETQKELLSVIGFFVGGLLLLNGLNGYVQQNTIFGRIEVRFDLMNDHAVKTCITSYPNTENADFLQKKSKAQMVTNSNNSPGEAIWNTLTLLLTNVGSLVLYMLVITSLSPVLILVVVLTTIMGYFVKKHMNAWKYAHKEEEGRFWGQMDYLLSLYQSEEAAKDIRIFGMKSWIQEIYQGVLAAYNVYANQEHTKYLIGNCVDVVLTILRNGIAYVYLVVMVLEGNMTAAQFLLYFTAIGGFTSWVKGILENVAVLHRQSIDISVFREFLEYPEPFAFEGGLPLHVQKKAYELELRNVSFKYPEEEENTISNMNLKIHPGEKLAIVGLNGAGKTTLVKLLCGFYDPDEGQVLLDGQDIRQYNRRDYYTLFSAVFQQFSLLETTIEENIVQFDNKIDTKRLYNCIQKADLTEKIQALPEQAKTHFSRKIYEDGVEFSGGEIQRLMLARALYKEAPILVLDEPTAALDPIAEDRIYQKYNEMAEGGTSIFISHRLASTRFCDRILFIKEGVIWEEGTHEELLNLGGEYARLFQIQSQYYQEGSEEDG